MNTIFSHIVQKHLSQVNEDVATDALAYVLDTSEAARRGMMKLLRGIVPDLPSLRFKTQQVEGTIRLDMWGFADTEPRVFVENKFWAGLTDNQPVSYLKQLATHPQPTLLLVVAPAAREQTLWRELTRRLLDAGMSFTERDAPAGVVCSITTQLGPVLALTSWTNILSVLEHATVDDPGARNDLVQLHALCDATDNDAFAPISAVERSDQRLPAYLLQLSSIVQAVVDCGITENALSVEGLRPQSSSERIGRYVWVPNREGAGAWLGIHFRLWKAHGTSPLWMLFFDTRFGRGHEVRPLIEPWAAKNRMITAACDRDLAIALDIPVGEEKAGVIRSLVDDLKAIASVLAALPPKTHKTQVPTGQE